MSTPSLEVSTKWFNKITIQSKVEGPMGVPPVELRSITLLRQNAPARRAGMNGEESPPKL